MSAKGEGGSGDATPTSPRSPFSFGRGNGRSNWRAAVDVAMSNHGEERRRRRMAAARKAEWGEFFAEQVDLLLDLSDPKKKNLLADSTTCSVHLHPLMRQDAAFLGQCLVVCLEARGLECTLNSLAIVDREVKAGKMSGGDAWPAVMPCLFKKALEMNNAEALADFLNWAYGDTTAAAEPKLPPAAVNDPLLLQACAKDGYDAVKTLVSHGYRLSLKNRMGDGAEEERSKRRKAKEKIADLPSYYFRGQKRSQMDDDDIFDMNLLRMMAKPSYIFACYMVLAERQDHGADSGWCQCSVQKKTGKPSSPFFRGLSKGSLAELGVPFSSKSSTPASTPAVSPEQQLHKVGLSELMSVKSSAPFHHCPSSERYRPSPDCSVHAECNDPIYRCFDLARIAHQFSDGLPEYRTECAEIAESCRALSADLLEGCSDSEEVSALLGEKSASAKYFKEHLALMRYPRVRLAIEHSHKEFAAHMYCQQFLRREWTGGSPWQGKGKIYKLFRFLVQTLLAPFLVLQGAFVQLGRDVGSLVMDSGIPPVDSAKSACEKLFLRYLHYCRRSTVNLDAPLNRFLTLLGHFLIFLGVIVLAAVRPLADDVTPGDSEFVTWYHWFLWVYSANVLYSYFLLFGMLRSVSHFFNVWRFFELFCHVNMFFSVCILIYLNVHQKCLHNEMAKITVCPDEVVSHYRKFHNVAVCTFSFAAISAFMRLTYLLQMEDKIGPIVIHYSKVILDVATMMVIYTIMIFAFSFGLISIISSDLILSDDPESNEEIRPGPGLLRDISTKFFNVTADHDPENVRNFVEEYFPSYSASFKKMLSTLFWAVLDPGQLPDLFQTDTTKGLVSATVFALFQVLACIIFLNLLIATMNSTVQRVDAQRQLYWKFTRTSIWIEFFDDVAVFPPPFTFLNFFGVCVVAVVKAVKEFRNRRQKKEGGGGDDDGKFGICLGDKTSRERRARHTKLMAKLVERLIKVKDGEDKGKSVELDKMKKEIVEEVMAKLKHA